MKKVQERGTQNQDDEFEINLSFQMYYCLTKHISLACSNSRKCEPTSLNQKAIESHGEKLRTASGYIFNYRRHTCAKVFVCFL